ncbi:unnamed protein product [Blepharisma stoltei]|uniref:Uncharacterized protein n=1 Tax=Blepharisma stoltei TaxID=1481888 RepID=A0AAU9J1G7_9CILI|nr:unnamed protein product [Blepharisma stoltei]
MKRDRFYSFRSNTTKAQSISPLQQRLLLHNKRKLNRSEVLKCDILTKIYAGHATKEDIFEFNAEIKLRKKPEEFERKVKTAYSNRRKLEIMIAQPKWDEETEMDQGETAFTSFDNQHSSSYTPKDVFIPSSTINSYTNKTNISPKQVSALNTFRRPFSATKRRQSLSEIQSQVYKVNSKHLDLSRPIRLRSKLYSRQNFLS